jgi:hypothetical protein
LKKEVKMEREKSSELRAIENNWRTLDDASIIRDVLFKGKFISNAIKFISERNNDKIEDTQKFFFEIIKNMTVILLQNKQLHRANHILKNAQLNEIHYLYDVMRELNDESVNSIVIEYIRKSGDDIQEAQLRANHTCYKLLIKNMKNHAKYLENINKLNNNFAITPANAEHPNLIFGSFMKQSQKWRNVMSHLIRMHRSIIDLISLSFTGNFG